MFSTLDAWELHRIVEALEFETFMKSQAVVKEGDLGDKMFIIEEGHAEVIVNG